MQRGNPTLRMGAATRFERRLVCRGEFALIGGALGYQGPLHRPITSVSGCGREVHSHHSWPGVDRVKNIKHWSVRMAAMQRHHRSRGGGAGLALCDGTREPLFFIPPTKTAPESAVTP